jgi:DNA-directed RNA polymerase III subunit RPC1
VNEFTQTYLDVLRNFIHDNVARKIAENRQSRGMFEALERDIEWDVDTDLSMGATGKLIRPLSYCDFHKPSAVSELTIVDNKAKVTEEQLRKFLDISWAKYAKARIEPGMSLAK